MKPATIALQRGGMGKSCRMSIWLVVIGSAVAARADPATDAATRRGVPGCGVSIEAPQSMHVVPTPDGGSGLLLERPDEASLAVACLPKRKVVAQNLTRFAQFMMGKLAAALDADLAVVASPALERSLNRPVVVAEGRSKKGLQATVAWSESVSSFYWMVYLVPLARAKQGAAERERLFASLRITDPLADRGSTEWWYPPIQREAQSLTQARAKFHTKVPRGRPAGPVFDGKPAPAPPPDVFDRIQVRGPVGRLWTYVTPDPKDHQKHPAVIWAHGGFGGIDEEFWKPAPRANDQSARAFRAAGIVLAVGSWRGENDNPGDYELYYGEVDDFLAIAEHVRKLPYVNPERIYLAGHSSGGTLVLLAAERSDRFRAAFSIGGDPIFDDPETYKRYAGVPFDAGNATETLLRSSAPFVRSIRRPTFHFEGGGYRSVGIAQWMAHEARKVEAPFHSFGMLQADHFTILAPLTELIARKIVADTEPTGAISFTSEEIDALQVETREPTQ